MHSIFIQIGYSVQFNFERHFLDVNQIKTLPISTLYLNFTYFKKSFQLNIHATIVSVKFLLKFKFA